jgi:hypothetical protein
MRRPDHARRHADLATRLRIIDDKICQLIERIEGVERSGPVQKDERMLSAVHESGHAVIARALGQPVERASLSNVYTRYRRGDQRAHRRELAIALAGLLAEHYYRPTTPIERDSLWRTAGRIDLANIRRHLAAGGGADVSVVARQVAALVRQRWSTILHAACALHARGMLSGDEVDALLVEEEGGAK